MESPSDSTADHPQPSEQDKSARNIPLAYWPSIKILQPPKGIYSPRPDERCLTYCSQTIAGRIAQRDPWCRSICIRKIFPHEVRNVLAVKTHRLVQPTGQANYPLPPEGQHSHDILGGALGEKNEPATSDIKHWEEGWYLWFSRSRWAALERLDLMSWDLERQTGWMKHKEQRRQDWTEWQERQQRRQRTGRDPDDHKPPVDDLSIPRPYPDTTGQSLLLQLPPSFPPIYEQVQTLLAPTYKVLELFHESIESGVQREFAGRVWDKAWTGDPLKLASIVCSRMWDKWKEGPPDDAESDGT